MRRRSQGIPSRIVLVLGGTIAGVALATAIGRLSEAEHTPKTADSRPAEPTTPEAHERAVLARHRAETADPSWAPQMSAAIHRVLQEGGQQGAFSVSPVDCRTTICVSTATWADRPSAERSFKSALWQRYPEGCSVSIVIPECNEAGKPCSAPTLFECIRRP